MVKYLAYKYGSVVRDDQFLGEDASYLETILDCLTASNKFMSTLYRCGLFIQRKDLRTIVSSGHAMLQGYAKCATKAHTKGFARFKLNPKFHMLCHVVFDLEASFTKKQVPINPLAYSCQMPEDFINKVATLSRQVNSTKVTIRTIDLYKLAVARSW